MDWHSRYLQQAGWTSKLRGYLFQRAGVDKASRVLEVGCGTGAVLKDDWTCIRIRPGYRSEFAERVLW
jgi:hypothetical protein